MSSSDDLPQILRIEFPVLFPISSREITEEIRISPPWKMVQGKTYLYITNEKGLVYSNKLNGKNGNFIEEESLSKNI